MSDLPLEQGIKALVDEFVAAGCPCMSTQPLEQRRAGYVASASLAGDQQAMARVQEIEQGHIRLKLFKPVTGDNLPLVVYFHGGCFVSGGFDTYEQQLRQIAYLSGAIVVAVSYRLAPEFSYPTAHDDGFAAVQYIREHAKNWGADVNNISLVGDSAGGHIALITSLRLREYADWLPNKQILIYPMLDATASCDSYQRNGDKYIITGGALTSGFDMYLQDSTADKLHPEISPLFRHDWAGLPETHILTAEFDPLVDEGEQLYRRLIAAGVTAHCRRYLGVIHGFYQLSAVSPSARQAIRDIAGIINN